MEQLLYWIWLSSLPGIGSVKCNKLIEYFKDPINIWNAKEETFQKFGFLNKKNIEVLIDKKNREGAKVYLENVYKNNVSAITINDDSYPYYLKNIYDPPIVIYKKGTLKKDEK